MIISLQAKIRKFR